MRVTDDSQPRRETRTGAEGAGPDRVAAERDALEGPRDARRADLEAAGRRSPSTASPGTSRVRTPDPSHREEPAPDPARAARPADALRSLRVPAGTCGRPSRSRGLLDREPLVERRPSRDHGRGGGPGEHVGRVP